MLTGTFDQGIQFSKKIGGARKVFEGQPWLLDGGFKFNLEDLPSVGQVLPAGAAVYCDEVNRTITPIYTVTVKEVASDGVTVAKDSWGVPVKAGMVVGTSGETITKVDENEDTYKITLSAVPTSAKAGGVITFFPKSVGKTGVKANALLPYDVSLDPSAKWANGEGAFNSDREVLINRTFPLTDAIKQQLRDAGCSFYFSNRK